MTDRVARILLCLLLAPASAWAEVEKSDKTAPLPGQVSATQKPEEKDKGPSLGSLTLTAIANVINKDTDFGEGYKVNAAFEKSKADPAKTDVLIQTWQNPKSEQIERDAKIDAVLMSKKVMDSAPDSVGLLGCFKIRYFNRTDRKSYFEISVFPDIVKAFGSGALSEATIIGTLPLERVAAPQATPDTPSGTSPTGTGEKPPDKPAAAKAPPIDGNTVVHIQPGWNEFDRARLVDKIKNLEKAAGHKAAAHRQLLGEMETAVRDHDDTLALKFYQSLYKAVGETEAQMRNTQKVAAVQAAATAAAAKTQAQNSKTAELANTMATIKAQAGDFFPHNGPMYPDRTQIGQKLLHMQKDGENVSSYRPEFLQMETLARNNNMGALEVAIKALNKKLGLPMMAHNSEYLSEQKLSDQLKKLGQD